MSLFSATHQRDLHASTTRHARTTSVPVEAVPGFIRYDSLPHFGWWLHITTCESRGTDESIRVAAQWIKDNVPGATSAPAGREGDLANGFSGQLPTASLSYAPGRPAHTGRATHPAPRPTRCGLAASAILCVPRGCRELAASFDSSTTCNSRMCRQLELASGGKMLRVGRRQDSPAHIAAALEHRSRTKRRPTLPPVSRQPGAWRLLFCYSGTPQVQSRTQERDSSAHCTAASSSSCCPPVELSALRRFSHGSSQRCSQESMGRFRRARVRAAVAKSF